MGYFDEMSDNKKSIIVGAAGVTVVGLMMFLSQKYQAYEKQKFWKLGLDLQIKKIRSEINQKNPSLNNVKRMLLFAIKSTFRQKNRLSQVFKEQRRQYTLEQRNMHLQEYLRLIIKQENQLKQVVQRYQQEVMIKVGLTQSLMRKYADTIFPFLNEQTIKQQTNSIPTEKLTLEKARRVVNLQISFFKQNGDSITEQLIRSVQSWSYQQKIQLPPVLDTYFADLVFENHQQFDQNDILATQIKFRLQIAPQLAELDKLMSSIVNKIAEGFGFRGKGVKLLQDMNMKEGVQLVEAFKQTIESVEARDVLDQIGLSEEKLKIINELQNYRKKDPQGFREIIEFMRQREKI